MKELSIEEKAHRYDEALERAKKWRNAPNIDKMPTYGNRIIEEIFPELAESEDERIRKEMINYLEPQGDCCGNKERWIAWLEKQSEQKPAEEYNITGIGSKNAQGKLGEMIKKKLEMEKQNEQKPDKVEPKFHEGDWVVSPNGVYWHIDKISNNRYEVTSNTGESSNWNLDTNIYHRFTIQDAKDGDVLATKPIEGYHSPFVAIYKKQNEEDFDSYCFIGFDGKLYKGENGHSIEEVHPATKEQRDALMKTMADTGYTFDFEKKELEKIEQKPAWSEEDERVIDDAVYYLEHYSSSEIIQGEFNKQYVLAIVDKLKFLKERYTWKPSDEQMEVLLSEVTGWTKGCPKQIVLESLYQDLKKLKG